MTYRIEDRGGHAAGSRRWQIRHVPSRLICPGLHATRAEAKAALAAIEAGGPDGLRAVDLAMAAGDAA